MHFDVQPLPAIIPAADFNHRQVREWRSMGYSAAELKRRHEPLLNDTTKRMNSRIFTGDNRNLRANKQFDSSKGVDLVNDFLKFIVDGGYTLEQLVYGFKGTYIRNHDGVAPGFYAELDADDSQAYPPVLPRRPAYVLNAPQQLPQVIHDNLDAPTVDLWLMNKERAFEFWYPNEFRAWDQKYRNSDGSRKSVPPLWAPRLKVAGVPTGPVPVPLTSSASTATQVSKTTLLNTLLAQNASVAPMITGTTGLQLHNAAASTFGLTTQHPNAALVAAIHIPHNLTGTLAMGTSMPLLAPNVNITTTDSNLAPDFGQGDAEQSLPEISKDEVNSLLGDDWLECVEAVERRIEGLQDEQRTGSDEPLLVELGQPPAERVATGTGVSAHQTDNYDHIGAEDTRRDLFPLDTMRSPAEPSSQTHPEHAQASQTSYMMPNPESMVSLARVDSAPYASLPRTAEADTDAFFAMGDEMQAHGMRWDACLGYY
jgi:hypothetical protein